MVSIPSICPLCGGEVTRLVGPVEWDVRGELVVVDDVEHGMCAVCGESFFDPEVAERLHRSAVVKLKRMRGLLPGSEIKALRESLGLSQAAFECLIGAGPKTVVRWENDSVFQNKTADTLLRVLRDYPVVAADLMAKTLR